MNRDSFVVSDSKSNFLQQWGIICQSISTIRYHFLQFLTVYENRRQLH